MQIDLDALLKHEAAYFSYAAQIQEMPWGVVMRCADLPESHEVNRVIGLRDDGRGAASIVAEVRAYFEGTGCELCVDTDSVSEAHGIGPELRRTGIMPIVGRRAYMELSLSGFEAIPFVPRPGVTAYEIDKQPQALSRWLSVNLHDVEETDIPETWAELARLEAECQQIKLFLSAVNETPAATTSLFIVDGLARIEMVETVAAMRRRGAASAAVHAALACAAAEGATTAYLFTDAGSDAERIYTSLGFKTAAINRFRRHLG